MALSALFCYYEKQVPAEALAGDGEGLPLRSGHFESSGWSSWPFFLFLLSVVILVSSSL